MNSVLIDLGPRSYPIHIGSGLLGQSGLLAPLVQGRQILVVTNEVVAPLYLDTLLQGLAEVRSECVILPDGEQHKNLDTLNLLFDALLRQHYGRDCVVIALGGGVVGDIAGFGAACYQRGVRVVQVPTTLLAQVDSAVGGKTAVNHALGKNMIGVFHQPACVICDTLTLRTLDERQLRAGLAEVIKYGLIGDLEFFEWIETRLAALLAREEDVLAEAVRRSCENKAAVVAADERESGVRALLNLGHTFGHAIETGLGYGVWLHGEAVAAGICLAADLSARMGWLAQADVARIVSVLARAGLPTHAPAALSPEHMLELMGVDKKRQHGRLRLVLLERVGHGVLTDAFDPAALTMTLEHCREAA